MFIAGYNELSLLDWEGKVACVLFLSGCNFRCPWCHNKELIDGTVGNTIPIEDVLQKLKDNPATAGWIDGFVIGGGEPTVNKDLIKIVSKIKSAGFLVKIDTNGSNPDIIRELIDKKLVDCVAMDIKAPLVQERYDAACGVVVDLSAIKKTIELLLNSPVDCLFRTTVVPGIVDEQDTVEIAKVVEGKKYRIQKVQVVESNRDEESNRG